MMAKFSVAFSFNQLRQMMTNRIISSINQSRILHWKLKCCGRRFFDWNILFSRILYAQNNYSNIFDWAVCQVGMVTCETLRSIFSEWVFGVFLETMGYQGPECCYFFKTSLIGTMCMDPGYSPLQYKTCIFWCHQRRLRGLVHMAGTSCFPRFMNYYSCKHWFERKGTTLT